MSVVLKATFQTLLVTFILLSYFPPPRRPDDQFLTDTCQQAFSQRQADGIPIERMRPLCLHVVASILFQLIKPSFHTSFAITLYWMTVIFCMAVAITISLLFVTFMLFQMPVASTCEVCCRLFVSEESSTK